jgi:dTMP kinase
MAGIFITFEGTEGSGKSTQIALLAARLRATGRTVRTLREPGGTPIGEEIRHLLKHSEANRAMTPETELLLMNASRAQLVREVIRPALAAGEIVLCDRYFDSTIAYQVYGRGLDLKMAQSVIATAVGTTQPDLTLMLMVPVDVSEQRRRERAMELKRTVGALQTVGRQQLTRDRNERDRMEEAGRDFFERVEKGYREIAAANPERIVEINANQEKFFVEKAVIAGVSARWPELVDTV